MAQSSRGPGGTLEHISWMISPFSVKDSAAIALRESMGEVIFLLGGSPISIFSDKATGHTEAAVGVHLEIPAV